MPIMLRKLFFVLLLIVLFLTIMNFFPESLSHTIHNRFNLDAETNIPTWFSTILLFSVSFISFVSYILSYQLCDEDSLRAFWLMFSFVYCFLSLDEAAQIHEIFDTVLHKKWIFFYAPFGALFFLTSSYFLIFLNKNVPLRVCILGGLIVYALGGLVGETIDYFFYGLRGRTSSVEVIFEEGLESLGTIIVLMGCLRELLQRYRATPSNVS